jgi:hypothetical protein
VLKDASSPVRVRATKLGYLPWDEWVPIPQSEFVIKLQRDPTPGLKMPPGATLKQHNGVASNTPSAPNWDQISGDLKNGYAVENVAEITRTGRLEFAQGSTGVTDKSSPNWRLEPLSRDGSYCRQFAFVTLQLADETRKCSEVAAVYKLVAKKWQFLEIIATNKSCSN